MGAFSRNLEPTGLSGSESEIQSQRQLDLPIRAESDLVRDCGGQGAKIRAHGGCREGLAGLQAGAGSAGDSLRQPQVAGIGEIRVIEDVVQL